MMDRCVEASTSALPVFLIRDSGDLKDDSIKLGLAPFLRGQIVLYPERNMFST